MKKIGLAILAIVGLGLIPGEAQAQSGAPFAVIKGSITVTVVQVSEASPTQVTVSTMASRVGLTIQNQDSTASLFCDFNPDDVSASTGFRLVPFATISLPMADRGRGNRAFDVWCQNDSGTGPTQASVIQFK